MSLNLSLCSSLRHAFAHTSGTHAGNLMEDPRAGIFLMDFATGDTLQLTGRAQILFDNHDMPGAERTIEFVTERWVRVESALPIRAPGPVGYSPFNPRGPYQFSEDLVKVTLHPMLVCN